MIPTLLPLFTEAQVADLLGLSIRTLQDWRLKGRGPAFVRLSDDGKRGSIRYRQQDVEAFVAARALSASEPFETDALAETAASKLRRLA